MVRSPEAEVASFLPPHDGLSADEGAFLEGLEAAIDAALKRVPRGERLVYGIHQELSERMGERLAERYRSVGWGDVRLLPGATGGTTLVIAEKLFVQGLPGSRP